MRNTYSNLKSVGIQGSLKQNKLIAPWNPDCAR